MNNATQTNSEGRKISAPILTVTSDASSALSPNPDGLAVAPFVFPEQINDSFDATTCEIFTANYGDNHRYIRDEDRWIHWDGRHWKADIKAQQLFYALEIMRTRLKAYSTNYHLEKIAKNLANQRSLSQIRKHLETRSELSLLGQDIDAHEHLCAFENAVYNTETNQLISDPNLIRPLFLTRRFPVVYDSSATCDKWKAFLNQIFCGDEALIRFVQKAVGLSLSGKVLEEKLFFAYGNGANGKSTFFVVLNSVFGSFHCEIDPSIFIKSRVPDQRLLLENMARLKAIRFATSNEIPERATYNDMAVKQLSSRDMINAKVVYQSVSSFKPTHKLWIRSNHKPLFNVRDGGMLRRICLVPFAYKVPVEDQIKNLVDILLRELKGILQWIVEGWILYQKEGLNELPSAMQKALNEYVHECDALRQFIDERYVVLDNGELTNNSVKLRDFTAAYNAWCKENNYRSSNSRDLAGELRAEGYEVANGAHNVIIINGLAQRDDCS
jgi:putative DNA primase/helicase